MTKVGPGSTDFSLVGRCRCCARGRSRLYPPRLFQRWCRARAGRVQGRAAIGRRIKQTARPPVPKIENFCRFLPVDFAWQNPCHPLHRGQGVPARCVGAPLCASWKTWWLGPYSFWTSCGIYLKGSEADCNFSWGAKGFRWFPEVHPVQDCRCRGFVLRPGLIRKACTDGEDRFRAKSPATGSNLENPVRPRPRPGGRIS